MDSNQDLPRSTEQTQPDLPSAKAAVEQSGTTPPPAQQAVESDSPADQRAKAKRQPTGNKRQAWFNAAAKEYTAKAIVTGILGVMALWTVLALLSWFGWRPSEVSMSPTGMTVKLEHRLANGVEYFIAVSPQVGWQDTDIEVKTTDKVEFWASGHVNLSVTRINESVQTRREIDKSIRESSRFVDSLKKDSLLTPEDFFTDSLLKLIKPRQPWVGPDGDTAMFDRTDRARTYRKLAPDIHYGRLIGVILPKANDPERSNAQYAFGIGRSLELQPNAGVGSGMPSRT